MAAAEDLEAAKRGEKERLLKEEAPASPTAQRVTMIERAKAVAANTAGAMIDTETERVMEYQTYHLGTWQTFFYVTGTIWTNKLLWTMVGRLLLVSIAIGFLIFFLFPNPTAIDATKFSQVSNLLKVFVGFLLGFFLTSSVNRWGNAVGGFLTLCNAIKSLMMMLHALGSPEERIETIMRYCLLSAEFLVIEMKLRTNADQKQLEIDEKMEKYVRKGRLREHERQTLAEVEDHAAMMWVWVVSLISRSSQDAEVPHMGSPTYGRLVMLANTAEEGIRQVVVASKVQLPFVYVHTLALLVHTNNLLCAVGFGCTLGTSIAAIFGRLGFHLYGKDMATESHGTIGSDLQAMMMAFITSFVVPLMYQAFLQIGLLLAQPFDNPSSTISAVPAKRLIHTLERDLVQFKVMATEIHGWEKPCYRNTPLAQTQLHPKPK